MSSLQNHFIQGVISNIEIMYQKENLIRYEIEISLCIPTPPYLQTILIFTAPNKIFFIFAKVAGTMNEGLIQLKYVCEELCQMFFSQRLTLLIQVKHKEAEI